MGSSCWRGDSSEGSELRLAGVGVLLEGVVSSDAVWSCWRGGPALMNELFIFFFSSFSFFSFSFLIRFSSSSFFFFSSFSCFFAFFSNSFCCFSFSMVLFSTSVSTEDALAIAGCSVLFAVGLQQAGTAAGCAARVMRSEQCMRQQSIEITNTLQIQY